MIKKVSLEARAQFLNLVKSWGVDMSNVSKIVVTLNGPNQLPEVVCSHIAVIDEEVEPHEPQPQD